MSVNEGGASEREKPKTMVNAREKQGDKADHVGEKNPKFEYIPTPGLSNNPSELNYTNIELFS